MPIERNMYRGIGEFMLTPDVALATGVSHDKLSSGRPHSLSSCLRAYQTCVHSLSTRPMSSRLLMDCLLLETCREVATQYSDLEVDDYHNEYVW